MARFMISLSRDAASQLVEQAIAERRDPRVQAALYIERALAADAAKTGTTTKRVPDVQPA
jgi:hypothetical protein